jgi:hypothetical protein
MELVFCLAVLVAFASSIQKLLFLVVPCAVVLHIAVRMFPALAGR